jgi:hypothetical protein
MTVFKASIISSASFFLTPNWISTFVRDSKSRRLSQAIAFTASTMCFADMPKASISSSGLPECGMFLTAISRDFEGAAPACANAARGGSSAGRDSPVNSASRLRPHAATRLHQFRPRPSGPRRPKATEAGAPAPA